MGFVRAGGDLFLMSLTKEVALGGGGLKFTRVMAGEYYADTPKGRYMIDHNWDGCSGCDHEHDHWLLTLSTGYRQAKELGKYRTLTDARIAATKDARRDE